MRWIFLDSYSYFSILSLYCLVMYPLLLVVWDWIVQICHLIFFFIFSVKLFLVYKCNVEIARFTMP